MMAKLRGVQRHDVGLVTQQRCRAVDSGKALRRSGTKRQGEWRAQFRNTLKSVYQFVDNPRGESVPVFILGCGRSGTNMLVRCCERTWALQIYNETHPAAFRHWRLRDWPVIEELVRRSHARAVVFKPLNDTYRATHILERFPRGRIVFQFRHYRDVVRSIIKGPFGGRKALIAHWLETDFAEFSSRPPSRQMKQTLSRLYRDDLNEESGSALYWLCQNSFLFDQNLHDDERVHLFNYESFVQAPEREWRRLSRFLGVPASTSAWRRVSTRSLGKGGKPDLDPEVERACDALWRRLAACAQQRGNLLLGGEQWSLEFS